MARRKEPQQPIRKSFLITGGIALGAALLGFVLMTFVIGGGGGDVDDPVAPTTTGAPQAPQGGTPATPAPTTPAEDPNRLTPGGRDPFSPAAGGAPAPAPEPAVAPAVETNEDVVEEVSVTLLEVYPDAADIKLNELGFEGARADEVLTPRFVLSEIDGDCVYLTDSGERFQVCKGSVVKR